MKRKALIAFVAAVICAVSTSCSFSNSEKNSDIDARSYLGNGVTAPPVSEAVTELFVETTTEAVTTEAPEETTAAEEAVTEPAEEEITAESLIDGVDYFAHQYDITFGTISETANMTAELDGETLDYSVYSNYSYKEYDETSYTGGTISSSVDDETYSAEYYSIYKDGYTTVYSKSSDEPGVWHKTTGSGKRRSYLGSTHFRELALEETDDQYIIKGQIKYAFLNQNLFGVIIPYGFEEAELSTLLDMTMYFDKETKTFKSYFIDFTPVLQGKTVNGISTYNSYTLNVTMDGYESGTLEIPDEVVNGAVAE